MDGYRPDAPFLDELFEPDGTPRPVAGPPKRFAQGIGATFSLSALILTGLGYWTAAQVVLGLLAVAATLEAALGICLGCMTFGALMKAGVVPEEVCERCNDIWATTGGAAV